MIKQKTNTISSYRNINYTQNQKGQGFEVQINSGRGSFLQQDIFQEDCINSQAIEAGKNSSKRLNHALTINYDNQGEYSNSYSNQQIAQVSKKIFSKPTAQIKKIGYQQQLPPKQPAVNLVNLNLNFSNGPQNQLPPTYPMIKNQENIINSQLDVANSKKKKQQIQQFNDVIYRLPQQSSNPNRLQKLQTLQPKIQVQQLQDDPVKAYQVEQQNQMTIVDISQCSPQVLINSTNFNKSTSNQTFQQNLASESQLINNETSINEKQEFTCQTSGTNEYLTRQICNHKQKVIKEVTHPFNQKIYYENKQNKVEQNSTEINLTSEDLLERMKKNLDITAQKVLQLKNKQRGFIDNSKKGYGDQPDSFNIKQLEQYDDSLLYNNNLQNNNENTKKGKQFYQQSQKSNLSVNINNHFNNFKYNGYRSDQNNNQLALRVSEGEEKLQQYLINNNQPTQMLEYEVEDIRNGFNQQRIFKNQRHNSNSQSREFEQNSIEYSENQKALINQFPLQIQRKEIINNKINKSQLNAGQLTEQNNLPQICEENIQNNDLIQQANQEVNKKTTRKIINANPSSKQTVNKRYSVISQTANSKQKAPSANSNALITQQQKDRLQKMDKEAYLELKIKIYLDFQRIINFSNNMTMQPVPVNGVKQYKAYITKGNNGVLIRAALKNRWWWSLSEQSEDYDNINFLWTQWRKPLFYKAIKNRSELCLNTIKDDEQEENLQVKVQTDKQSLQQIDVDQQKPVNGVENANLQLENQNQNEEVDNNSILTVAKDITACSENKESLQLEPSSTNNDQRWGYNDASPTKNLNDFILKSNSKKQNQGNSSPTGGMRSNQESTKQDPYSKINGLVNEKDLQLLINYTKISKKKKQNADNIIPIFTKEEYPQGIEREYEKIRNQGGQQVQVFKNPIKQKMHNHMEYNFHLANKKALFYNMRQYYNLTNKNVFDYLPTTFHIQSGLNDPEFANFVNYYNKFEQENPKRKNVWIIKPGESSNRGNGIQVAGDVNSVRDIIRVRESHQNGFKKTYIIQKYLDRPFLYNKRKFDIRCFMLMTNYNNTLKAYWYTDGYIRTSTKEFTLKNLENRMIHLTNEAVQKRGEDFGKFENGNKLSYAEFQKYIDSTYPKENYNFMQQIYPQMKQLAYDSVCSVYTKIDKKKRNFSFELFGLDFMIDDSFKTWLIEINTNPSLTIAAPLMSRLLPALIDNVLKIAIDPIFPPPNFPKSKKHLIPEQIYENNKFELLFDSEVDGERIKKLYQNISNKIDEQIEEDCKNEEVYDDDDADVDQEGEENEDEEGY
ncbi:tubulin-tyrosine ligase family protein (macronuclear) [Tetrahymena thermophila SB210]|uniref:Tubulin-tyrosine ligase family protein n=1 Tax=Tetrahymena thermophila (strain SB210) TaxID=312017 RepID=I7M9L1_TETTS|nr:tubulin-tyrosine ligase family protein [Tetrahymena thermophila SB210]EAS02045.3 tubulin-tyrosine ligase family protein [Tetrahymena thermophila SB210]|eukprot:XP_001022290.3 tubulin-tyrosine ligase family protein [Tetrahymena thermophila SB210]